MVTNQQTVGATAIQIAPMRIGRKTILIQQTGTVAVYIGGDASVSTTSGFPLIGTAGVTLALDTEAPIWAISATSGTISVMEIM